MNATRLTTWPATCEMDIDVQQCIAALAPACCPGATGQWPSALPLTDRGDGGHNLAELQLVQDGRFTSRIKSHLQHSAGKRFAGCRSFAGAGRLLHPLGSELCATGAAPASLTSWSQDILRTKFYEILLNIKQRVGSGAGCRTALAADTREARSMPAAEATAVAQQLSVQLLVRQDLISCGTALVLQLVRPVHATQSSTKLEA